MTVLSYLALDEVIGLVSFSEAPIGSVLQFRVGNEIAVGMKTKYPAATGEISVAVIFGGEANGALVQEPQIRGPVMDITHLVDLIALNPCSVENQATGQIGMGSLHKSLTLSGVFYIWGVLSIAPNQILGEWICVLSSDPNVKVGSSSLSFDRSKLLPISSSLDIRRRAQA